jgi:hypothetical protein
MVRFARHPSAIVLGGINQRSSARAFIHNNLFTGVSARLGGLCIRSKEAARLLQKSQAGRLAPL